MTQKTNKEILKKLNKEIRLKKDARKPSHPQHKEFFPYYVNHVDEWKERFEVRCRGIIQAFNNRNIAIWKISTVRFKECMRQICCEASRTEANEILQSHLEKFLENNE